MPTRIIYIFNTHWEVEALKTREQIYGGEASDILRNIAMYKTLTVDQVCRFYPGREKVTKNLLSHLARQGRIYKNPKNGRVSANAECDANPDSGLSAAVWVLLDFIDKAEYHSASDFPVKISFFADGELYEIVYVAFEQETLISHALEGHGEPYARRIVLMDCPEQIGDINVPNAIGFCSVRPDGDVHYYKLD